MTSRLNNRNSSLKFRLHVLIPQHGIRHFDGVLGVVFQLVQSEFGWREGSNGRNKVRQLDKQEHSWQNYASTETRRATIYYDRQSRQNGFFGKFLQPFSYIFWKQTNFMFMIFIDEKSWAKANRLDFESSDIVFG